MGSKGMKRKRGMMLFRKTMVCALFILIISSNVSSLKMGEKKTDTSSLLDSASFEMQDDVRILHLNGTYYQMGYQHGSLLKEEVNENIRAYLHYIEEISSYEVVLDMWNTTKTYVQPCYIEELQGLSDGADVSLETIGVCYMVILCIDMQCFTYAAWSNATIDGRLYHIRSLDFPLTIIDPETGKHIQENSVLIVRKPQNGLRSLVPTIAGGINFYQGLNEEQISIGVEVCWSSDQTLQGIPVKFKIQEILDTATTLEEAIQILTKNNTLGWNFILSDGKENTGHVIEISANHTYVGTWDDPVEGTDPFWKIEDVVRRTNFFIEPTLAQTQRDDYDPHGISGLLKIFTKNEPFFPLWRKYRSMSREIERNWGDIDLNTSISLLRRVYTGKTDPYMYLFLNFGKNTILCDFHQWALCPETGEFLISFADADHYAHEVELHQFNMYDLFSMDYR